MFSRENPRQTDPQNDHTVPVDVVAGTQLGVIFPMKFRIFGADVWYKTKLINSEWRAFEGGRGMEYRCEVQIESEDGEVFQREVDLYHDGDFWLLPKVQLPRLFEVA